MEVLNKVSKEILSGRWRHRIRGLESALAGEIQLSELLTFVQSRLAGTELANTARGAKDFADVARILAVAGSDAAGAMVTDLPRGKFAERICKAVAGAKFPIDDEASSDSSVSVSSRTSRIAARGVALAAKAARAVVLNSAPEVQDLAERAAARVAHDVTAAAAAAATTTAQQEAIGATMRTLQASEDSLRSFVRDEAAAAAAHAATRALDQMRHEHARAAQDAGRLADARAARAEAEVKGLHGKLGEVTSLLQELMRSPHRPEQRPRRQRRTDDDATSTTSSTRSSARHPLPSAGLAPTLTGGNPFSPDAWKEAAGTRDITSLVQGALARYRYAVADPVARAAFRALADAVIDVSNSAAGTDDPYERIEPLVRRLLGTLRAVEYVLPHGADRGRFLDMALDTLEGEWSHRHVSRMLKEVSEQCPRKEATPKWGGARGTPAGRGGRAPPGGPAGRKGGRP